MMTTIVGIDPGAQGAIAILSPKNPPKVVDIPKTDEAILSLLKKNLQNKDCIVFLEDVHALPRQSTVAGFTFGKNVGKAELIALSYSSNVVKVSPQRWKKHFGLYKKEKKESVALARQLFPSLVETLKISKDGRAEALLIASYGLHHFKVLDK